MVGQPEAVRILKTKLKAGKLPHAIMFDGPSGAGKTTLGRILKSKLKCHDIDYFEMNAADMGGIDDIRSYKARMNNKAMGGGTKIWHIDEAQGLTNQAQNALLKMLEETPKHVYVIISTTDSRKIIKAIHTRCTTIKLKPVSEADLTGLVVSVAKKEGLRLSKSVTREIVRASDGSPRKSLVILDSVQNIEKEKDQLRAIHAADIQKQGIDLARALLKGRWLDIKAVLKDLDEDAESLRRLVLSYVGNAVAGNMPMTARAFAILLAFRDDFFNCGKAGLVLACFEACGIKPSR